MSIKYSSFVTVENEFKLAVIQKVFFRFSKLEFESTETLRYGTENYIRQYTTEIVREWIHLLFYCVFIHLPGCIIDVKPLDRQK